MIQVYLFAVFFFVWIAAGIGLIVGWLRISRKDKKVDKQEFVQLYLMVAFWLLFGVEIFHHPFSYDKWVILLGSLVISVGFKVYEKVKSNNRNSSSNSS